jgi:hypothetical protein
LNEEQVKQIKDIENDNTDKIGKMIDNNNNIFNLDKNKINFVGFPTLFNFNKDNKIINESLNMKNLFKNINIDNINKDQNLLNSKKINKFDVFLSNGGNEKTKKQMEKKEDNSSDKDILNLPNIPSFFNDKIEEPKIQYNNFMNINNNIFNNNMINISDIHNNLMKSIFNKDFTNNLFSQEKKKDLNPISKKFQLPTNVFPNSNLNDLNLLNLSNDNNLFRPIPPSLNIPILPLNKNSNNKSEQMFNSINNGNNINKNLFLGQKRFNIN